MSTSTISDMAAINDDGMAWITRLTALRAQKKALAEAEKEAIAQIRALTAGRRVVLHDGNIVAYDKQVISRRIDPKMLREEYPEAAFACTIESVSQRFELAEL